MKTIGELTAEQLHEFVNGAYRAQHPARDVQGGRVEALAADHRTGFGLATQLAAARPNRPHKT